MDKTHILVYGMTDNPGGIETYILNLFKFLNKDEIIFDFVTDSSAIVYNDFFKKYGSRVHFIHPKSKNLWYHLTDWKNILYNYPEYKVVYFNILDAGAVFSMLVPWLLRRRIVVHSHNGDTNKKYLHYLCRPLLCFMASDYISCSKLASSYMFLSTKAKQALIIPNAIDIDKFKYNPLQREYLRSKLGFGKKFIVCHIGRITKQKNPFGVIDIFDALYHKYSNTILLYVGTGDMENEIKQYALTKESCDNIQFYGVRRDIPDILQISDVFLFPSFYEGLGIAAIEAQAAGVPCVLSDTIPKEVKVMPNVIFKSLQYDSVDNWAQALLDAKRFERSTNQQALIERGYDFRNCSYYYNQLLECLMR